MKLLWVLLCFCLPSLVSAQTVSPDESQIIVPSPKKIGINLNGPTYYQGGEIYKNLLWRNPGFEPDLYRDKFVAFTAGTSTTFPSPNYYDPVPQDFWKGATFRLYRGLPRETVCSGTVAGNTKAILGIGPIYRFANACGSAVQPGDVIVLRKMDACTAQESWEHQGAGWWGSASNGGHLLSECDTPYDGVQSLRMDATAKGSTATLSGYIDTNPTDVGILIQGQYSITGYYRTIGDATLSVNARRIVDSSTGNPLSCATQTFGTAAKWTQFTAVCNGYETKQVNFGPIAVTITAQNGTVLLDDVSFQKSAGTDPANTTVFRDELLTTLKAHCAGASLTAVPCELRDWAFQNADEIDNTIKPLFQRSPTLPGTNYDLPPNGGTGSNSVGLEEFLQLCLAIGAEPYYALPETTGPEDAAKWIEYLNGSTGTTYGAKRAANGHPDSWLKTFATVHLPMGNENWNEGATGQGLGYRPGTPDYYYDYSVDTAGVWNAMRASASWPKNGAGIDLVLGLQTGNPDYGVTEAMNRAKPDSAELAPYTQSYIGDVSPLTSLWNPLFFEAASNTTNPAMTFYQQAAAIRKHGRVNIYEFDNNTNQGSWELTQSVLDSFTAAAGYGTATALQALQHLSSGVVDQNFFSLDQYAFSIPNVGYVHNWGAVIDMGGATDAVRPQELGMRMANAAIIGPMYACPVTNPTTYDLPANHNGSDSSGMPATKNVPQQFAYCFLSGKQRSMIVINTDVVHPQTVRFAGRQAPAGTVTVTRYAPASISDTNEAGANEPTNNAPQRVAISAPFTVADPASDRLPPYSITRYDWTSAVSTLPAATSTSLAVSSVSPVTGAALLLTVTVSPSAASGTVSFQDGKTTIGTATLVNGSATYTVNAITQGLHTLTATYQGNSVYTGSVSSAINVTAKTAANLTLTASQSTPLAGTPVVLLATVSPSQISGSLIFFEGTVNLGTAKILLGRAAFPIASIAPGEHTYTVTYGGSDLFAAATSAPLTVTASKLPTVTALTASSNTLTAGVPFLLSAQVSPTLVTGTVQFLDGDVSLGMVAVTSGRATITVHNVVAGQHSYRAAYLGDSKYAASKSAAVPVTAVPAVPYLRTLFNERPAGSALTGTSPALNTVKAVWSDPNGDWSYRAGGGIVTRTPDLTNPALLNVGYADYTATYNLPDTGIHLLFRYVNNSNTVFVVTFAKEIALYATVNGKDSKLASISADNTTGPLTVSLHGLEGAITYGNQTAYGVIPSTLNQSKIIGFLPSTRNSVASLEVLP